MMDNPSHCCQSYHIHNHRFVRMSGMAIVHIRSHRFVRMSCMAIVRIHNHRFVHMNCMAVEQSVGLRKYCM